MSQAELLISSQKVFILVFLATLIQMFFGYESMILIILLTFFMDAEINGNKIFIRDAGLSSYDNYPYMLLQKDSLIYGFGQGWGNGNENNGIIEHMIKSFHFLK